MGSGGDNFQRQHPIQGHIDPNLLSPEDAAEEIREEEALKRMRTAGYHRDVTKAVPLDEFLHPTAPLPEKARGRSDEGIQAMLPPTLLELKQVIKKYLRLESMRIFLGGRKEILTERDYGMIEPGDTVVVVDSRGKRADVAEIMRRASLDSDVQSSRLILPPETKKLIHFTSSTETADHYVDHKDHPHAELVVDPSRSRNSGLQGGCAPTPYDGWLSRIEPPLNVKDGRPHSPTRNEQIAMTEAKKLPSESPWWKSAQFKTTSEARDKYVPVERTEILDTRETTLKNLRSDFHLFSHSSSNRVHRTYGNTDSEVHGNYRAPDVEKLSQIKQARAAGCVEERVTNTRQVPIHPAQRWWETGKFDGTTTSRTAFVEPEVQDKEKLIAGAQAEHHSLWKPDKRIGIEPGSLLSSRRESAELDVPPSDGRRDSQESQESVLTAGKCGPFPRAELDKRYAEETKHMPMVKSITGELHRHRAYGQS
jgi:hypothetical protein